MARRIQHDVRDSTLDGRLGGAWTLWRTDPVCDRLKRVRDAMVRVSVTGLDEVTHSVDVQASSLFEAASVALTAFRQHQGWATEALTPQRSVPSRYGNPPTVHDVPLKAIEQWRRSPATSPRATLSSPRSVAKRSGDRVRAALKNGRRRWLHRAVRRRPRKPERATSPNLATR